MFLTPLQLRTSLNKLERVHPIYGITYLVCKESNLPIGDVVRFPINNLEESFLQRYYKPFAESDYYYRVSRLSDPTKHWVSRKYASSTLQSSRTRGDLSRAFNHPTNIEWGWHPERINLLASYLDHKRLPKVPAFDLAVWLYRDVDWPQETKPSDIIKYFLLAFNITSDETQSLFDLSVPDISIDQIFRGTPISIRELRQIIGNPPDAQPDEGGTLSYLELSSVGPVEKIIFEPSERLNIITGDNGLGKSFLLDCAWWAFTRHWPEYPALPRESAAKRLPSITFKISGRNESSGKTTALYNRKLQQWEIQDRDRPAIPGLLIYGLVDDSYAVWDPAGIYAGYEFRHVNDNSSGYLIFSNNTIWDGIEEKVEGKTRIRSNGLIRDWITWQSKPEIYPFDIFKNILKRLSPPDESDIGALEPGCPTRLPDDAREIPTLRHPYGEVPILHASAGIRRIVALAYLIVWAWEEHKTRSEAIRRPPQQRMVILLDEMEAHLHPKWQRMILPALLGLGEELDSHLEVQFIVTTHSPIILSSAEPLFDNNIDKLFHLDLDSKGAPINEVILRELEFYRRGRVDQWLMSEALEETSPLSVEAAEAIETAKALQLQDRPDVNEIKAVHNRLSKLLAENDDFWPRWLFFAEQHGVTI